MQAENQGQPNPADELDKLSKEHGVSLKKACERTGVSYSTVWRWRNKTPGIFLSYFKLRAAIVELSAERDKP